MKKLIFFGNCQANALLELFSYSKNLKNSFSWRVFPGVFAVTPDEVSTLHQELRKTDVFLFHPVHEEYRDNLGVGSETLKSFLPEDSLKISISPVYWNGYNPELFYMRNQDGSHMVKTFDYHNALIFRSYLQGLSIEETLSLFKDPDACTVNLENHLMGLNELSYRESHIDIGVEPFIRNHFQETRLFWTLNHPTNFLLFYIADQIFKHLGIENDLVSFNDPQNIKYTIKLNELLGAVSFPILAGVSRNLNLKFSDPFIFRLGGHEFNPCDVVSNYFKFYDEHTDLVGINKNIVDLL